MRLKKLAKKEGFGEYIANPQRLEILEESEIREKRYLLIKAFSYFIDVPPTDSSKTLVDKALEYGYIDSRKALSGNRLKTWAQQKKAPEWACRSAARYLSDSGYQPETDAEKNLLEYYKGLDDE